MGSYPEWKSSILRRRAVQVFLAIIVFLTLLRYLPFSSVRLSRPSYDVVMAYYDEDLDGARETMEYVQQSIPRLGSSRRIIYVKGKLDNDKRAALNKLADDVVILPNVGREGETYLNHIVRNYGSGIADYTIFVQPHLAWHWVIKPRLDMLARTSHLGFMSLGPYVIQQLGKEEYGIPRLPDIYTMFRQEFYPPDAILATWAGQFIVSRKRILDNSEKSYSNLLNMFHAPLDHWIWKEGWDNSEPSNPTLGHALERSWPAIFNCTDAKMEKECGEGAGQHCLCKD